MGAIYDAYVLNKKNAKASNGIVSFTFEFNNDIYEVISPTRRARKRDVIRCVNGAIVWEHVPYLYKLMGKCHSEKISLGTYSPEADRVKIFVINGKPNSITGLDEGIFSSRISNDKKYVYVITSDGLKRY